MRVFVLPATYKLRVSTESHLRDQPSSECFWSLSDPDPQLFFTNPDPSSNKQKKLEKNLISTEL
jgi:hypothetical protein